MIVLGTVHMITFLFIFMTVKFNLRNFRIAVPVIAPIMVTVYYITEEKQTWSPARPLFVRAVEYYHICKDGSAGILVKPPIIVSALKYYHIHDLDSNAMPGSAVVPHCACPQPLVVWTTYYIAANGPRASPGCTQMPWPFAFRHPFFIWATYYIQIDVDADESK